MKPEDIHKHLQSAADKMYIHGDKAVEHLSPDERGSVLFACGCDYRMEPNDIRVEHDGVLHMIFDNVALVVVDGKYRAYQKYKGRQ